ncbi:MAG: endolytic transglycosylase MltG [Deinococcales bacterium]
MKGFIWSLLIFVLLFGGAIALGLHYLQNLPVAANASNANAQVNMVEAFNILTKNQSLAALETLPQSEGLAAANRISDVLANPPESTSVGERPENFDREGFDRESPNSGGLKFLEFEILPGWGAKRIAQELETRGIIQNAMLFSLLLRYQGIDTKIGEGLYELSPQMNALEVAHVLAAGGRPRTLRLIIPEGFRSTDISLKMHELGFGRPKDGLYLMRFPRDLRLSDIPIDGDLEGYLFPASYDIPLHSNSHDVIAMMLERFEQELSPERLAKLEELNLSVHQWVILASIVQSEAGNDEEMPIIAGVFLNRLDEGMPLQSDPTVAYGLGKNLNQLDASAGDFTAKADHPWNTYTRAGLPWGPISNPGSAALEAVLKPSRKNDKGQDYFYFLHGKDGLLRANTNLNDHNRDVARYLR